jgi:hypothetical protein
LVKKNNQGDTAKYEVKKNNQGAKYEVKDEDYLPYNYEEDEDYLACKALSKSYDRKDFEKLLVKGGLDKIIDFDKFFST